MSFFDEYVDFFDAVQHTSWYKGLLEEFAEFLTVAPAMTVLDVGCGPGYLTRLLAWRVRTVACFDLSPNMVERAREHAVKEGVENASYAVAVATSIPDESGYYDLAVATSVIYFVDDPVAALGEMARVVKAGGEVAMLNPSDAMSDQRVRSTIAKLKLSGFDAESLWDWLSAAKGARRLSEAYATKVMMEAGLSDIVHERHLNEMVLFSKGRKPQP